MKTRLIFLLPLLFSLLVVATLIQKRRNWNYRNQLLMMLAQMAKH